MAVLREPTSNREYPLRGKITILGRDPLCDVVVTTDRTSWRHALIFHTNQGHAIEDLDSVNGTFVNGKRINQRTLLRQGDRVDLPGLAVVFHDDVPVAGTKPTSTANIANPSLAEDRRDKPGGSPGQAAPKAAPLQLLEAGFRVPTDMTVQLKQEELASILTTLEVGDGGRLEVRPEAKLKAVLEISRALGNAVRLDDAMPKILESLFVIFPQAERGFILLVDPDTGQLVCKATRSRQTAESAPPISQGILGHVLKTGRAILSADAGHDERFDPYQSIHRFRIGSLMCVPMLSPGGVKEETVPLPLGVIQIDTKDRRQPFDEEDLEVMISATTQVARAVELSRLYQERSDLEAAIRIQKSFLPDGRPELDGLSFWDYYSAARQIGGDYYDYIPLPGGRLAVALGDVSGKGVAAALQMARVSAAARFCLATEPTVPEAVQRLNVILTQGNGADRFVTFVVLVIDLNDYSLTLVNAGHPPVLRRRGPKSVLSELGDTIVGLPLGVFDRPYEEMKFALEPGDTLILYTDGVTEARDPQGDFYGIDRLRAVVRTGADDVKALGEAIREDVRRFAAGRPQSDDLTLVCLRRKS